MVANSNMFNPRGLSVMQQASPAKCTLHWSVKVTWSSAVLDGSSSTRNLKLIFSIMCNMCGHVYLHIQVLWLCLLFTWLVLGLMGYLECTSLKLSKIGNIIEILVSTWENLCQHKVMHTIVGDLGTRLDVIQHLELKWCAWNMWQVDFCSGLP